MKNVAAIQILFGALGKVNKKLKKYINQIMVQHLREIALLNAAGILRFVLEKSDVT